MLHEHVRMHVKAYECPWFESSIMHARVYIWVFQHVYGFTLSSLYSSISFFSFITLIVMALLYNIDVTI